MVTNEQESTASDLLLASLQVSIPSSVASEFESKNELIFIFLAEPDRNAQIGSIKLAILRIDKPVRFGNGFLTSSIKELYGSDALHLCVVY